MHEFYVWPSNLRLFITFFFAVCVLIQTGNVVLSSYRYPKTRIHAYESILEFAIGLQILCLSLLHGQVYMCFDMSNVAPTGYAGVRIIAFICVSASAGLLCIMSRRALPLIAVLPALVTLPAVEVMLSGAYPFAYLLSLLFLLLRGAYLCFRRYREIKTGLSAMSVKSAIDNLHTGILFSREDGRILLMSGRMQVLMTQIAGAVQRNANLFYERLTGGDYDGRCKRAELDDQVLCLLPDETAWMFTRTDIKIKGRLYIQLTASDVSERYRLIARLKAQDEALRERSEELKQTLADLQTLSRDREAQRAKMRAHDVLGQRLTLLLRMVRGDQELDISLLKSMSEGLLRELSVGRDIPQPDDELASLRQIFGAIGVEVKVDGGLPEREVQARLFVDIIREGVVNAVRHGFATEVQVLSSFEDSRWCLRIQNNGHLPDRPIVEGGGIGGMREKLSLNGGTLQVTQNPRFALSVTLPGGES